MTDAERKLTMDSSGFVLRSDKVPAIVQEIRYHSTYNFIGEQEFQDNSTAFFRFRFYFTIFRLRKL